MNLLTKAATGLARISAAYDAQLLKSLNVDYLGRTNPMGGAQFVGVGGAQWWGTGGNELVGVGYSNHGVAYSIVSYILDTAAPLPWAAYKLDAADERAEKQPNHPLAELLYRPNPRQNWAEFKRQCEGGYTVKGECFIRRVKPIAGSKRGKTAEIWCLVGNVQPLPLTGLGEFDTPTGYRHTDALTNRVTDYAADEILHLHTWNPLNPHVGLSPFAAGNDSVTVAKSGTENRVRQNQNQGPGYVLFDKKAVDPWTAAQSQSVRSWLASFFSGGRNYGQIPITGGELGAVQLGLSPKDLDLLAGIPYDKDAVADLLHFPGQLLNGSKGTTFSNMAEAGAALYSRCVIPLETVLRDGLNRWLGSEYNDDVYLDFDVSHIPELQPNKEKLAQWLAAAYWIPVVEKQKMMGIAADWDGPKYVVGSTYMSYEDLGGVPLPADTAPTRGQATN